MELSSGAGNALHSFEKEAKSVLLSSSAYSVWGFAPMEIKHARQLGRGGVIQSRRQTRLDGVLILQEEEGMLILLRGSPSTADAPVSSCKHANHLFILR